MDSKELTEEIAIELLLCLDELEAAAFEKRPVNAAIIGEHLTNISYFNVQISMKPPQVISAYSLN